MKSFDRLSDMFITQLVFQGKLDNTGKINEFNIDFLKENYLGAITELCESLQETNWKSWKKNGVTDRDKAKEELIDCWHFLINISLMLGMNSDDFYEEFMKKHKVNRKRLKERY